MQMLFSATETVTIGNATLNALIVVLVVFAALIVLSLVIGLFGIFGKKNGAPAKVATASPAAVPAPASAAPAAQDEEELIAVIGAAVAMMQPEGVQYTVKKIAPVRKTIATAKRSEWAAAALRQNTMPF